MRVGIAVRSVGVISGPDGCRVDLGAGRGVRRESVFAVPRCAGWFRDERIADGHRDARVAEYLSDSCIAHIL